MHFALEVIILECFLVKLSQGILRVKKVMQCGNGKKEISPTLMDNVRK
jgi:hypothetical protein